MLMAEGHCSFWKHTNLSSLCYHLRLCWPLGQAATKGQVWIHDSIVARFCVDAHDTYSHQRSCEWQGCGPCWFPEPNCHREHTDLSGLHCQPGPWWYPGPRNSKSHVDVRGLTTDRVCVDVQDWCRLGSVGGPGRACYSDLSTGELVLPLLAASMGEIQPPPWKTDHTDVDVGELASTLGGIESENWSPASKLRRQKSWPWPLPGEPVLVELWTDQHSYHPGSDSGLWDGPA